MLIPTGIPLEAKARTSRLVKSGFLKCYTSNAGPQGKYFKVVSAPSTNLFSNKDSS
jgi:hypothetical protein